ncbi:hypothetical protein ASPZODRAFT_2114649 [Penicilliopsis zonata CBS 506.65]|uniref:Nucleoporin NUP37 n=1 Tax=Penicilliopsis zonata CBS 506.65 TaxID=1073090 RepID=A0A1L9S8A2_9EURO|nr:hypothetical protein ASPZODRAFT_2114649 [Penicilliopsis zonata CBS 506.65]OJJ43387.1 hypothetical protein ASPZODRAFT_2114649 [Penicilliopsis zonata CBS 506.65]
MASSMTARPLVRQRDDGLQLSYQLPHRVHVAKGYPLLAPNGSSIILYGYENGIRVTWRGGKPFGQRKESVSEENPKAKATAANDDVVMIIDSDEEDTSAAPPRPQQQTQRPTYEFLEEETEVDPTHPYEDIIRQIDIPLGSRVLDLAVPPVLPATARSALDPFPSILSEMIVVAAVCADYSTRVVALPLVPPHPEETEGAWGAQTLSINGIFSHQEIPKGVAITFTCEEDVEDASQWDLLVATHSAEASGKLLIYRIPIIEGSAGANKVYTLSEDGIQPIQRSYMPAPAENIVFNPSPYPSKRHSTLLASFSSGCVKVYSCLSARSSRSTRTGSSAPKSNAEAVEPEGKWLISLYTGFEQPGSGPVRRKAVIHAEWVLGGRAVMVLMADGEWGVWDLEGAGPGSVKGPLHRQSSVQGITGGSLTAFSVTGRILGSPSASGKPSSDGRSTSSTEQRPRFAPMTPSTKRIREDGLLKGSSMVAPSRSLTGQISVHQTNTTRDSLPEEAILFRHGDQSAIVPSLLSLWRNATKAMGTFDSSNRCRVSAIPDVQLMGEKLKGICHLPVAQSKARKAPGQKTFDILITAEHWVMILAPRLAEPETTARTLSPRLSEQPTAETDQLMLRRGELDVDGMDRLLSGMAGGARSLRIASPTKKARIFA